MLMCAIYKVLQHADVCYNLPSGVWIIYDSKVKKNTEEGPDFLNTMCL